MDPWMIDAVSGTPAYSANEVRLASAAWLTGSGTSLGTRSGIRPSSGTATDLSVLAQSTPNMSVRVLPGLAVVQGTTSTTQGPYIYVLDSTKTLTIAASSPSQTRIDSICIRVRDSNVDTSGQRDGDVVVVTGTPGSGAPTPPSDATYVEIARVTVPANAPNIGGSGGGTITDLRPFTAAAGGVLYGTSSTLPDPSTVPPGTLAWFANVSGSARLNYSDGVNWQYVNGRGTGTSVTTPLDDNGGTTTSTTYTDVLTGASALSTTFVVPTSGKVLITISGAVTGADPQAAYLSYRLSGGATASASDAWALAAVRFTQAAMSYLHTGLNNGSTVTVTAQHRVSGGTGVFDKRRISIMPAF